MPTIFFVRKNGGRKRGKKAMEREKFLTILHELQRVCRAINAEELEERGDTPVIYEVLQFSELARQRDSIQRIADFYNHNWLGNTEFIHIPDFEQTLRNCQSYPVLIARQQETGELLGISTIKYGENTDDQIAPYYPAEYTSYFSITGILVKKDNPYRGIGKKINEIALRGAYAYEKSYPGTKLMEEIDCRNKNSLQALACATERINQGQKIGEGIELPVHILGYYELRDKENGQLLEAPTLVVEVDLAGREVQAKEQEERRLSYTREGEGNELYAHILQTLKEQFRKFGFHQPVIHEDVGCGMVTFNPLQDVRSCHISNIRIEENGTAQGNDRRPVDDSTIHNSMEPMIDIGLEEEENEI